MRADEVLSDQAVREIMSDRYMDREEAVIFVVEPSSEPITPADMMFAPLINAEFSKNKDLGMVYGTGRGCALIRKTALQDVQSLTIESNLNISTCREWVGALKRKGYRVKQTPLLNLDLRPTSPMNSIGSQSLSILGLSPAKYLILMLSMPFIGAFIGTFVGIAIGDWKLGGFWGLMVGLAVSLFGQHRFHRKKWK